MSVTQLRRLDGQRVIEGDWYPGTIPEGAEIDATAYVGSSQSFVRYRSRLPVGVQVGRAASLCDATSLDIGPCGMVRLGDYALVTAARIVCDVEVEIGDFALVSWDVLIMDSYRVPIDPVRRRRMLAGDTTAAPCDAARPVRIGRNSWVGFGACILPGVNIGAGSIIAARSVVASDVPPYVVVAGNPARIVRRLQDGPAGG